MREIDPVAIGLASVTSPYDHYRRRAHRLRAAAFRLALRRLRKNIGSAYRLDANQPSARTRKLIPVAR